MAHLDCYSISGVAFSLLIRYIADCRDELTTLNGTITSPGYPHYYPSGSPYECIYTISQPFGAYIKLTFLELDIEWSTGCTYDWLEMEEYGNKLTDRLCGYTSHIPPPITSKENQVIIRYEN